MSDKLRPGSLLADSIPRQGGLGARNVGAVATACKAVARFAAGLDTSASASDNLMHMIAVGRTVSVGLSGS